MDECGNEISSDFYNYNPLLHRLNYIPNNYNNQPLISDKSSWPIGVYEDIRKYIKPLWISKVPTSITKLRRSPLVIMKNTAKPHPTIFTPISNLVHSFVNRVFPTTEVY